MTTTFADSITTLGPVFTTNNFLGVYGLFGILLTFLTAVAITRNINEWKILFLPIAIGWWLVGIKTPIWFLALCLLFFVIESWSKGLTNSIGIATRRTLHLGANILDQANYPTKITGWMRDKAKKLTPERPSSTMSGYVDEQFQKFARPKVKPIEPEIVSFGDALSRYHKGEVWMGENLQKQLESPDMMRKRIITERENAFNKWVRKQKRQRKQQAIQQEPITKNKFNWRFT